VLVDTGGHLSLQLLAGQCYDHGASGIACQLLKCCCPSDCAACQPGPAAGPRSRPLLATLHASKLTIRPAYCSGIDGQLFAHSCGRLRALYVSKQDTWLVLGRPDGKPRGIHHRLRLLVAGRRPNEMATSTASMPVAWNGGCEADLLSQPIRKVRPDCFEPTWRVFRWH
jgi:hypothetical protein